MWLVTDARNDDVIEPVLARLPRGSGLIYRHYHLEPAARRARFEALARLARSRGHLVILSGSPRQARSWGADGAYGPARLLAGGPACLRLVTAHSLRELAAAGRRGDTVLLSPVFSTRSHPGGTVLGPVRFRLLARQSPVPVTALGGMTASRARALQAESWAAIDGLSG